MDEPRIRYCSNIARALLERWNTNELRETGEAAKAAGEYAAQCLRAAELEYGKFDFDLYNQYKYLIEKLCKDQDGLGLFQLTQEMGEEMKAAVYNDVWGKHKSDWRKYQFEGWKAQLSPEDLEALEGRLAREEKVAREDNDNV